MPRGGTTRATDEAMGLLEGWLGGVAPGTDTVWPGGGATWADPLDRVGLPKRRGASVRRAAGGTGALGEDNPSEKPLVSKKRDKVVWATGP